LRYAVLAFVSNWAFLVFAVGLASLLTNLGFGVGLFERLGNVLDSEAWNLLSSQTIFAFF